MPAVRRASRRRDQAGLAAAVCLLFNRRLPAAVLRSRRSPGTRPSDRACPPVRTARVRAAPGRDALRSPAAYLHFGKAQSGPSAGAQSAAPRARRASQPQESPERPGLRTRREPDLEDLLRAGPASQRPAGPKVSMSVDEMDPHRTVRCSVQSPSTSRSPAVNEKPENAPVGSTTPACAYSVSPRSAGSSRIGIVTLADPNALVRVNSGAVTPAR